MKMGQLSLQEKELAQNADQFASKQEFDTWAANQGFFSEQINRAWQANENAVDRVFKDSQRQSTQAFQTDLANLNNQFSMGQISFTNMIEQQNKTNDAIARSYYNEGLSGKQLDDTELNQLRNSNPMAYYSYQDGLAGKDINETQRRNDAMTEYRNALVVGLDTSAPAFQNNLNNIWKELYGGDIPLVRPVYDTTKAYSGPENSPGQLGPKNDYFI